MLLLWADNRGLDNGKMQTDTVSKATPRLSTLAIIAEITAAWEKSPYEYSTRLVKDGHITARFARRSLNTALVFYIW